ncbi:MAG TPA: hypothetical protein VEA37_11520 [Flavobacterium sp.]|nr:hypothetical protein [Flavobacterium sp.]
MNIITYLKEVPLMKRILGYSLILFGLCAFLFFNIIMGAVFIGLGVNFVATTGSQINLTNKTYRKTTSIFGIEFGTWKPCPEFEYVSVFRTNESQTVNFITATATSTESIILLNMFYDTNKHITFYKTTDKADAFKVAQHFKMVFNMDILDATEREKKWLD